MKYTTLLLLFLSLSLSSFSQVFVNGININELDIQYCELIKTGNDYVRINYGQDNPSKRTKISKQDMNVIKFNSGLDALNFMVANGWELVSSTKGFRPVYNDFMEIYLLKKVSD